MTYSVSAFGAQHDLSQEEWDSLLSVLAESEQFLSGHDLTAAQIASDNYISEAEITSYLDGDRDGELTVRDFRYFSSHALNELEAALKKHNYNLMSQCHLRRISLDEVRDVPDAFWSNPDFVLEMISGSYNTMQYASADLRGDRDFMLAAINRNWRVMSYASDGLLRDKDFILEIVKQSPWLFGFIPHNFRGDKDIALEAIKYNSRLYQSASETLRAEPSFILEAAKLNNEIMRYVSPDFWENKDFILEVIGQNGLAILEYAPENLRNDRDYVLEMVRGAAGLPDMTLDELADNRDVMLKAVQQYGLLLRYASDALRNDEELVIAAVSQDYMAIGYASEEMRTKFNVVDTALRSKLVARLYVDVFNPRRQLTDSVEEQIKPRIRRLFTEYPELQNERRFINIIIKFDEIGFRYASDDLKNNRDAVLHAVWANWHSYFFASDRIKRDLEIITEAAMQRRHFTVMEAVPRGLRQRAWERILARLEESGYVVSGIMRNYGRLVARLGELGIDEPERIGLSRMATVLANREVDRSDARPIALMIYAKRLERELGYGEIYRVADSGIFRVLYYEAENDDEVFEIIRTVFHDYGRQIHTLWLGGHGTEMALNLNGGSINYFTNLPNDGDDDRFLDPSDFSAGLGDLLGEVIASNGQLVLASCSTGKGGEEAHNLTNRFAQYLPRGVRILSLSTDTSISHVLINSEGLVTITQGDANPAYVTHGRMASTMTDLDAIRGLFHDPDPGLRQEAIDDYFSLISQLPQDEYIQKIEELLRNHSDEDLYFRALQICRGLIGSLPAEAWAEHMGIIDILLGVSDPDLHREVVKICWELNRLFPVEVQDRHPRIMETLFDDLGERIDTLDQSIHLFLAQ